MLNWRGTHLKGRILDTMRLDQAQLGRMIREVLIGRPKTDQDGGTELTRIRASQRARRAERF